MTAWLKSFGHFYAVCRSVDEIDDILVSWGWV